MVAVRLRVHLFAMLRNTHSPGEWPFTQRDGRFTGLVVRKERSIPE
jgi:hypothetical protein